MVVHNKYYDVERAKNTMDSFIIQRVNCEEHLISLSQPVPTAILSFSECGDPKCHRVIHSSSGGSEELDDSIDLQAVFAIQGVISKFEFNIPNSLKPVKEHCLILTGFSSPYFEQIIANITNIDIRMSREVGGKWKDWCCTSWQGHPTIVLTCRHVTPTYQCSSPSDSLTVQHIPHEWDPENVLKNLIDSGKYAILDENVIHFQRFDEGEQPRVFPASPSNFKEGDIAEAHIIFCSVPTVDGAHKLKLILRALILKDSTLTDESLRKSRTRRPTPYDRNRPRGRPLKRLLTPVGIRDNSAEPSSAAASKSATALASTFTHAMHIEEDKVD